MGADCIVGFLDRHPRFFEAFRLQFLISDFGLFERRAYTGASFLGLFADIVSRGAEQAFRVTGEGPEILK